MQLYNVVGDQIGFTWGIFMKNKLLAQLKTSSQWSWGMSSSVELKYKLSAEQKYKLLVELTKLHAKLMMSSQRNYMQSLSSHLSEAK